MIAALRDSVRTWRRSPGVALVAALSLALGIGATAAAFSVVEQLLLRTLSVPEPHRLVQLITSDRPTLSYAVWEEVRQRRHLFDAGYAWLRRPVNIAPAGEAELARGAFVSSGVFATLGVSPALGRVFTDADDLPAGGPDGHVAVLTHGFWMRRFDGADVVGRTLTIERVPFTVIGVLPASLPGLQVGAALDLLLPLRSNTAVMAPFPSLVDSPQRQMLRVVLRLRQEVPIANALEALRADQPAIRAAALPGAYRTPADRDAFLRGPFLLLPAANGGGETRYAGVPAAIALGLAAAVLLAACGNVAMVLLAHGAIRQRELALRAALGASPWNGPRQRFADSVVLAAVGMAGGLILAYVGGAWLASQLATFSVYQAAQVGTNWRTAAFAAAGGLVAALACGFLPALNARRTAPDDVLKATGPRHTASDRGLRVAVGIQLALSVTVIVIGLLLWRSYAALAARAAGIRTEGAYVVELLMERSAIPREARPRLLEEVRAALAGAGGSAASATGLPSYGGSYQERIVVADAPAERSEMTSLNTVSGEYFVATGARTVAGRTFAASDVAGAPTVGVVNEAFVDRVLDGSLRLPRRVWRPLEGEARQLIEIVGVISDQPQYTILDPVLPELYLHAPQDPLFFTGSPLVIAHAAPGVAPAALSSVVNRAAPVLSFTTRPYLDLVWLGFERDRLLGRLAMFFVGLAALLAGIGLFGVLSFAVASRQRELGVRIALGARAAQIHALVLRRAGTLLLIGGGAGVIASLGAGRLVASQLHGVSAADPASLAVVAGFTGLVGLAAAWLPARRAARVDPVVVLRHD